MLLTSRTARAAADPANLQTFSTISLPGVHRERVTCERVDCAARREGWRANIDESTKIGQACAHYIRQVTRRQWVESVDETGAVTVFTFPPGTPCFRDGRDARAQQLFDCAPHERNTRPALHVVSAGSAPMVQAQIAATGRPDRVERTHVSGTEWAENLAESWDRMAHQINS